MAISSALTMDRLPCELLASIASHIKSAVDVGHYRLASRRLSVAAAPVLATHLSVESTGQALQEFARFMQANEAWAVWVKHLTIFHAVLTSCHCGGADEYPPLWSGRGGLEGERGGASTQLGRFRF